jgi:fatty acid desaturase
MRPEKQQGSDERAKLLPGIAAIGLWMFFMCLMCLLGVSMRRLPHVFLLFCVAFALAGHGLIRLRRWGWALTLAAVFLSGLWGLWTLIHFHQVDWLAMILVNAILFLYLVRPEVTTRLR